MKTLISKFLCLLLLGFVLSWTVAGVSFAATELVVYAASPPEEMAAYNEAFEADHPEIKLKWVSDSTGIITAKLLAEKDNRKADVVWGISVASLIIFDKEGMLDPYAPAGLKKLDSRYVDSQTPPHWIGRAAWATSICMNMVEAKKLGLPKPTTWKDMAKPIYKGFVAMPNPASSGTGYLTINAWLQIYGEKEAWDFMDALHKNISVYTHSGSKPAKMAAAGEVVFGFSQPAHGTLLKNKGAPLEVIVPSEGIGWDMEGGGILKGTSKLEAARTLMDWNASPNCARVAAKFNAGVAIPGMEKPVEGYPPEVYKKMIKIDFKQMSENKKRVLDEWLKRYDVKSEPK